MSPSRTGINEMGTELLRAFQCRPSKADNEVAAPGFYSSPQWANRWQLSLSHTIHIIADKMEAGEMERRVYRQFKHGWQRLHPTPFYKEVKPPVRHRT